ncbi:MAG: site-specific integrase [Anaerolineales bacterium]|nr:site-specific integrase [Anaerolineales bacterium]
MTFLSVCYRDGLLPDEQARRLGLQPYKPRRQRDRKPTGRRLSPQEVKKLRATVDTAVLKGKRDLAILDMMLYAGLRRAEVCSLTGDSLQQQDGRFWLTIQGKGSKTRRLKVHDVLYQSLADWLAEAGKLKQTKDVLFEGMTRHGRLTGNPLTGATVGRIVAEYGHAAGLAPASGANALAPHDLRRTCARNAYDNGAPPPKIQQFLGHANIETTMRYIGYDEDDTETATDYVRY